MLTRSLHVKGVSRFQSAKAVELAKATVIFADNGLGKTTLSAVLRSLQTGDPFHILERRTLGAVEAPTIGFVGSLGAGNTRFTFDGAKWNTVLAACEIFDTKFISDNVYSGDQIDPEHRKQLHRFVLGASNVTLASKVDELDNEIRALNTDLVAVEAEVRQFILGSLELDKFLKLAPDTSVTEKIEVQEQRVAAARQADSIQSADILKQLTLPAADFSLLEVVLRSSLADVEREAEEQVRNHLRIRLDDHGERWIAKGLAYLESSHDCPFCGTDTSPISLVTAYKAFFSDSYVDHRQQTASAAKNLSEIFSDAVIERCENVRSSNTSLRTFWETLGVPAIPPLLLEELRNPLKEVRRNYSELFEEKQRDVLVPIAINASTQKAISAFEVLKEKVAEYNNAIKQANAVAEDLKKQSQNADLASERAILELLKNTQRRYEPDAAAQCDRLIAERKRKESLEREKKEAKEMLDQATDNLFKQYQTGINRHLANCGCGYTITGTKTGYAGGKPRTDYQLQFDKHVVELNPPKGKADSPSFKNTLSDGDRSTLAFALFLARLELDQGLNDKIVVLDDPMTSLDAHRRAYTCQQIAILATKCRQIILLTHDAPFAREVWDRLSKPKIALTIQRQGKYSVITEWDILRETQSEYFKLCSLIRDYIDGKPVQDKRSVATALRVVLEGNLRMRFPDYFEPEQWLGQFIQAIRDSEANDYLAGMKPKLQELTDLNDYSKQFHHDQNPGATSAPVIDAELLAFAKRTLNFLAGM